MTRVRDHVEVVTLHPVAPSTLTTAERAAFLASLRDPDDCPVCDGHGGPLLDEWGYERTPCPGGCDTPPATVVPESEAP